MVTKSSVPTGQKKEKKKEKKKVLELQTCQLAPMSCGATRTVTGQYEATGQSGNTLLTSSTITWQAGPPTGPSPQLRLHTSPFAKVVPTQLLRAQQQQRPGRNHDGVGSLQLLSSGSPVSPSTSHRSWVPRAPGLSQGLPPAHMGQETRMGLWRADEGCLPCRFQLLRKGPEK